MVEARSIQAFHVIEYESFLILTMAAILGRGECRLESAAKPLEKVAFLIKQSCSEAIWTSQVWRMTEYVAVQSWLV